jgi:ribonuclease D
MSVHFHEEDLPKGLQHPIAIDTEAMAAPGRDRLCPGPADGRVTSTWSGFRRKRLFVEPEGPARDPERLKIYHSPRFDTLSCALIQCHGGAGLLHEDRLAAGAHLHRLHSQRAGQGNLGQDLSKQQRPATGATDISDAQREYAASDVRYLHRLKEQLDQRLIRENRMELAQACFDFLPARAMLDLAGWAEQDIFAHV